MKTSDKGNLISPIKEKQRIYLSITFPPHVLFMPSMAWMIYICIGESVLLICSKESIKPVGWHIKLIVKRLILASISSIFCNIRIKKLNGIMLIYHTKILLVAYLPLT